MSIADVLQGRVAVDSEVTVRGQVHTRRGSKAGISFLAVYNGSCFDPVQAVVNSSLPNCNEDVLRLTAGCSVIVVSRVMASPGQRQRFEIQTSKVEVTDWVEDPDTYPMAAKYHNTKYLREVAYLRLRTDLIGAVVCIRHTLAQALHRFFNEQGLSWVSTPPITTSDTEGTGEVLRVSTLGLKNLPHNNQGKVGFDKDFFGKESFLTVPGQLNGEIYTCTLSKIYAFGPTFRTEDSSTSHHLTEFWMLEPEVAFTSLNDIAGLAGAILKYVFKAVLKERADDMKLFAERVNKDTVSRLKHFIEADFAQVDYTDTVTILENYDRKSEGPVYWGVDLSSEYKCYLAEEHFRAPVVVKSCLKDIKVFRMRLNENGKTVAAMGILAPGVGEIIGGSQHEERLDVLDERMLEIGLDKEDYWWYRDLRRYGIVPHSGFSLGFGRLIAYVTGVRNVRDVIPFPHIPRNANF